MTTGALALLRAAHGVPTLAVTVLALLLAVTADLGPARTALVTAAVLAGQLSIGWSNDLVDAGRDRAVATTAMVPPPPVRFSTATGWPNSSASRAASSRAVGIR